MKILRIISRNIRDSFKSVIRNLSLSSASITITSLTLLIVSVSLLLTYNINNFTTLVEKDMTIVVFLDSKIKDEDVKVIEYQTKEISNVKSVVYNSKKQITEEMSKSSDVYKAIMEKWSDEENPLSPSFLIKVKDINKVKDTADKIKEFKGVNVVKYGEGMTEVLISIFDVIKKVSLIIVGVLMLVTSFLISNTIKLTIYSRRKEIEIMRLIGASNFAIKLPFIFEGLFLGILGSIIPILTTIYGYNYIYVNYHDKMISPVIQLLQTFPTTIYISGILLCLGMVVGIIGSYGAVRKYLKI